MKKTSSTAIIWSVFLVFCILLFPGHPKEFVPSALQRLPLELPIIVLLLLVVNRRMARWLCAALVVAFGLLLLLRLADIGSYLAFNRRFSPLLELHLVADGWNLASTAIGPTEASIITFIALLVLLALALLLYRCLRTISQLTGRFRKSLIWISAVACVTGLGAIAAEYHYSFNGPVEARIIPEFSRRITSIQKSVTDQRQFVADLTKDSVLDNATPQFNALAGRDVIVIFVESYGRGYLDAERFSAVARTRLDAVNHTLNDANLHVKSGWVTSPIRGGRSWLAHSTFQSGLKISNQARFDRLVTTDRPSVTRLFQQAGWRTVGLMPAIQFDWPEGAWYGYESNLTSNQLGYAGERFGYVTMPDQYTLAHFENAIRNESDQPLMATIALLSTHAPWTPLPIKIDWDTIGDGSVYDGTHRFGEPISWKYRSKVQDMYALSFDYTLDVIGEYAARYARDAVIIVLGDHQPAPIINGWGKSGDVPIHIITSDLSLLERLPDQYWNEGMTPNDQIESQRMSSMRKMLSTFFE